MPMMNWLTTGSEVAWVLRDRRRARRTWTSTGISRGEVVKIRLFNDPSIEPRDGSIPIHLHGQRFLVLDRDGVRNDNLVWKDTAIIPAG